MSSGVKNTHAPILREQEIAYFAFSIWSSSLSAALWQNSKNKMVTDGVRLHPNEVKWLIQQSSEGTNLSDSQQVGKPTSANRTFHPNNAHHKQSNGTMTSNINILLLTSWQRPSPPRAAQWQWSIRAEKYHSWALSPWSCASYHSCQRTLPKQGKSVQCFRMDQWLREVLKHTCLLVFTDVTIESKGCCTLTCEKEKHKIIWKLTFSLAQATMWSSPMSVRPCFDAKSHNTASVYLI